MRDLSLLEAAAQPVATLDALLAEGLAPLRPELCWVAPAGTATPAAVYARAGAAPGRLLLESARPDPASGRYSFLTGDPRALLWHRAGLTYLADPAGAWARAWAGDPFAALQAFASRYLAPAAGAWPTPFPAGLAGFLGYGLRRWIEPTPPRPADGTGLPDALLGLYDSILTFDHLTGQVCATGRPDGAPARWAAALAGAGPDAPPAPPAPLPPDAVCRSHTRGAYEAAVARIRAHIRAGDIYQANLTQHFAVPCAADGWTLYRRLRQANPAPFAAYLPWPGATVVSASPERFLQVARRTVITQPIKGTRPRGADPAEDARLAAALRASAKDRAENVMIVDLLRNDLGRVCTIGSVQVPALLQLESYATVHHLVSTITGQLAPGADCVDLLRACWPGGSITGAPKIRAMEIIATLEPRERGIYCGSIGYLSVTGAMDTSIVIRTLTLAGGVAHLDAGGGVVADSKPAAEYAESLAKAAALLRVLGVDPAALLAHDARMP